MASTMHHHNCCLQRPTKQFIHEVAPMHTWSSVFFPLWFPLCVNLYRHDKLSRIECVWNWRSHFWSYGLPTQAGRHLANFTTIVKFFFIIHTQYAFILKDRYLLMKVIWSGFTSKWRSKALETPISKNPHLFPSQLQRNSTMSAILCPIFEGEKRWLKRYLIWISKQFPECKKAPVDAGNNCKGWISDVPCFFSAIAHTSAIKSVSRSAGEP